MDTWTMFFAIAIITTLSGFVQSAMGFGYAIVALAILPLVLDIQTANILVSLSIILPLAVAVWAYRHGIDWTTMASCLAGASLGLALGLVVFSTVDGDWLTRATGIVILLLALDSLRMHGNREAQPRFSKGWSAVAGAVGGLLSGSIGIGGPPLAVYAARQMWSPVRFKAFLAGVSLLLSLLKGLGLAATGWIDQTVLVYSAAAVPFGLVGCQLGIVVSRNFNAHRFQRVTMGLLALLAIGMIVRGQPDSTRIDARASRQRQPAGRNLRRLARRLAPSNVLDPAAWRRRSGDPQQRKGRHMKTIAIIGGGFCGTMTAVNLARLSNYPLRVVIVNARRPLGRGTAYGTDRGEHLLNVAARNMSALPDMPSHFLDWLRTRWEFKDLPHDQLREMFAPRRVYGDYLSGLLGACLHPIDARSQVKLETVEDEAVDIVVTGDERATILLGSGDAVEADQVVLATGNQPPGSFASAAPLRHDARYCADPWEDWRGRLPAAGGRIVLLGTGLTMVDVVLTLVELAWQGEIVAVSRGGMLPQSHFRGIAYEDYVPADAESLGLDGLVELVERHCRRLRQMSQNPAIAIDKLRPHTQRLWRSLSTAERQSFLSRYAAPWNVTRHRIAAAIHDTITDALDRGRLKVVTGTIQQLVPNEQNIEVVLRDPDGGELSQSGDLVINCTGPQARFAQSGVPLFDNLLRRRLACEDELAMGIRTSDEFALIGGDGQPSRLLFAIGPLLKGSLWETTAVPELRGQAMRVAEILLEREPAAVEQEDVIEYYI